MRIGPVQRRFAWFADMATFVDDYLADLGARTVVCIATILSALEPQPEAAAEPDLDERDFDPARWRGALDPHDGLPPDHP
jgi:hypothetical protein